MEPHAVEIGDLPLKYVTLPVIEGDSGLIACVYVQQHLHGIPRCHRVFSVMKEFGSQTFPALLWSYIERHAISLEEAFAAEFEMCDDETCKKPGRLFGNDRVGAGSLSKPPHRSPIEEEHGSETALIERHHGIEILAPITANDQNDILPT